MVMDLIIIALVIYLCYIFRDQIAILLMCLVGFAFFALAAGCIAVSELYAATCTWLKGRAK